MFLARTASVLDELGLGEGRLGVEEASWFLTPQDLRRLREARVVGRRRGDEETERQLPYSVVSLP